MSRRSHHHKCISLFLNIQIRIPQPRIIKIFIPPFRVMFTESFLNRANLRAEISFYKKYILHFLHHLKIHYAGILTEFESYSRQQKYFWPASPRGASLTG